MPLLPRTVSLDTPGIFTLVEPSQIIDMVFVSAATLNAPYYIRLGQAEPSGPYFGKGLTVRLGEGTPMSERSEGLWCVVKQGEITPNGRIVFQVGFAKGGGR